MTRCAILERPFAFSAIISGTAMRVNAKRPLTRQLDATERGLAMNASRDNRAPEYFAWMNMRYRCNKPSHALYSYYGGRGVTVCEGWNDSYANFLADMGPRPGPEYSLDRIDNADGGYWCGHCTECVRLGRPANCRWATRLQQQANIRTARLLTFNGKTQCMSEWAREIGMSHQSLAYRLGLGMPVEKALTRPRQQGRRAK